MSEARGEASQNQELANDLVSSKGESASNHDFGHTKACNTEGTTHPLESLSLCGSLDRSVSLSLSLSMAIALT